jgi:flagellar biosynthesis GTPase FlhF
MRKAILFILILVFPAKVMASVAGEVNKANGLYKQGKIDDSVDLYQEALDKDQDSPAIKYNLGTAFYKKGDYPKALSYLQQAAHDKDLKIKSKAEYNLGNVLYKAGKQKENTDIDKAIKSLQGALGQYVQTLRDVPNDPDAKFNEDFVKKEIERLKKKKQQQQQQNQQNQKNQQNQQNKQDQKNQQNQQNKQNQQNQQNQQGQQNQQNQQKQQDQQNQQGQQKQQEEQKKAQAKAEEEQKDIDRKQAEDLLEDYQENEEPKKLLNYMPKKIDDRPVLRDW